MKKIVNFADNIDKKVMKEFLKSVVDHYIPTITSTEDSIDGLGLADYLFVFPNRRSGLFFYQYLFERVGRPIVAPDMTTISELFPRLQDTQKLKVIDRIELLFYLYKVYIDVSKNNETFDNFVFWGEMLLSDFNDADKYLVDTRLLFENVRDLKEIEEKFGGLEEEQIKIIRTFWTNFRPEKKGESKELFRETWQILYDVYIRFKDLLLSNNKAYDGMLQRRIVESLQKNALLERDCKEQLTYTFEEEQTRLQSLLGKKVVFVGLTALSKTELELMHHLSKYKMAEFCWDYADYRLNDKNSHASFFKSSTIDVFANAIAGKELESGLVADKDKHFEVIEVPSGVGQTIQAANILRKWNKEGYDAFRTAVVLPDEKMLLPMLYSMPKEFEPFNVTMGYSLKATSIATFIDSLALLQNNIQKTSKGEYSFYYKNVLPLLGSNYLLKMTNGKAEEIQRDIVKNNKYRVTVEAFKGDLLLEQVFKPCAGGKDCIKYLNDILDIFARQAENELQKSDAQQQEQGIFGDVEREFLFSYISLVKRLEDAVRLFDVEFSQKTFFTLLRKLAQSETVAFSGEPLSGLQVMGVLETRGLDFENLIILSMNEGIFPAKPMTNTFIPMNLRFAFGMPTQAHKDSVFAYHFYRLISRAKNVIMIYDSRSDGLQNGEPSRYIKQLSYLYGIKPEYKTVQYAIGVEEMTPISIKKDESVMQKLRQCLAGEGSRSLSATTLKHYILCPLRFYLEFVEGLREEDEMEEGIDNKAFGSIVHETMEKIFEGTEGKTVTATLLENLIKNREYLRRLIEKAFRNILKVEEITGYLSLVEETILTYVTDILKHDKTLGEFTYVASEKIENYVYKVHKEDGSSLMDVNIKAIYDRIDIVSDTLRIVDYKTGKSKIGEKSKLIVPDIDTIFSEKSKCSEEAFQVMLYSVLIALPPATSPQGRGSKTQEKLENHSLALEGRGLGGRAISPNLYFVRDFHQNIGLNTVLQYESDNEPMSDFNRFKTDFCKAFDKLLIEIFDPDKNFRQTDIVYNCSFCPFKNICKRN